MRRQRLNLGVAVPRTGIEHALDGNRCGPMSLVIELGCRGVIDAPARWTSMSTIAEAQPTAGSAEAKCPTHSAAE